MSQSTRPSEGPALLPWAVAGGAILALQVGSKAVRDGLFLSQVAASELPRAMLAAAVLAVPIVLGVSYAITRHGPGRIAAWLLLASASLFSLEWLLVPADPKIAAWLLYLHIATLGGTTISAFFSCIAERFDPHSARAASGAITSGAAIGGLIGGSVVSGLAGLVDIRTILLGLALGCLGCAVALVAIGIGGKVAAAEPAAGSLAIGFARSPYLRSIAYLVLLTGFVSALLDYGLKAGASSALGTGPELLQLFAAFHAGTALLTAVVQVGLARRALEKLGLAATLATLPASVLLTGALGALVPPLWSRLLMRGASSVLESSLFRSAYEPLYTPLSERARRGAKTLIDVAAGRLGEALGSGLLLILALLLPAAVSGAVLGIALAAAALALLLSLRLHAGYIGALTHSLRKGSVQLHDAEVMDSTTRLTLSQTHAELTRADLLAQLAVLRASLPAAVPAEQAHVAAAPGARASAAAQLAVGLERRAGSGSEPARAGTGAAGDGARPVASEQGAGLEQLRSGRGTGSAGDAGLAGTAGTERERSATGGRAGSGPGEGVAGSTAGRKDRTSGSVPTDRASRRHSSERVRARPRDAEPDPRVPDGDQRDHVADSRRDDTGRGRAPSPRPVAEEPSGALARPSLVGSSAGEPRKPVLTTERAAWLASAPPDGVVVAGMPVSAPPPSGPRDAARSDDAGVPASAPPSSGPRDAARSDDAGMPASAPPSSGPRDAARSDDAAASPASSWPSEATSPAPAELAAGNLSTPPSGQPLSAPLVLGRTLLPAAAPPRGAWAEADAALLRGVGDLLSADRTRVLRALQGEPLEPRLVAFAIPLLAHGSLIEPLTAALKKVAERSAGQLVDAMHDPEQPLIVRRRIPRILKGCNAPRSVQGLIAALQAPERELRHRAATALSELTSAHPELAPQASLVYELVRSELRLTGDEPLHLHHIFSILSLALEREALRLARRALSYGDARQHGTALEYLHNTLPEPLRSELVARLESGQVRTSPGMRISRPPSA